jgi:hypothetical protein
MPKGNKRKLIVDASGAAVWTLVGCLYLTIAGLPLGWGVLALPVSGAATSMLLDSTRKWAAKGETRPLGRRFLAAILLGALLAVMAAMLAKLGALAISVALFGGALAGFLVAFGVVLLMGLF